MRKKLQHLKHRVIIPLFTLIAFLTRIGADLSFTATVVPEEAGFLPKTTAQNWADNEGHRGGHGPIERRDIALSRRRVAPPPPPPPPPTAETMTLRPPIGARKEVEARMAAVDSGAVNSVVRCYRLHNRCSRRFVRIYGSRVDAFARENSIYGELQVESRFTDGGQFTIQGIASKSYLCFNRKGRLIVKHSARNRSCLFDEVYSADHYSKFESVANRTWTIGFGWGGRRLPGDRWTRSPKERRCFQFQKLYYDGGCDGRETDAGLGPGPGKSGPHRLQHSGVRRQRSLLKT